MNVSKMWPLAVSCLLLMFSTACSDEEGQDDLQGSGEIQIEITDAPIDDASVSGAFVTISEVRVDGQPFAGFTGKQTINLLAYQRGDTKALGLGELEAGSYSDIALVLDYAADANGNEPGCYVQDQDGNKFDLRSESNSSSEIVIRNSDFQVEENSRTDLVIDFDLRKSVAREDDDDDEYAFVAKSRLEASLRSVVKTRTGTIEGSCNSGFDYADKIVVYAYQKGAFNEETETEDQASDDIRFRNSVTSALVAGDGSYELHFLQEGEYELFFATYEEDDEGEFELTGSLLLELIGNLNLQNISVNASATTEVNVTALGKLPL